MKKVARLFLFLLCLALLFGTFPVHAVNTSETGQIALYQTLSYAAAQAKWQAYQTCVHTNGLYFSDTDLNQVFFHCLACGQNMAVEQPPLDTKILKTSSAIRSACQHVWGNWSAINEEMHGRSCSVCHSIVYDTHTIIPANCTENAYCADCGMMHEDWPKAYGHYMGYYYDSSQFGIATTHEYRCLNRDESDNDFICDYVASVQNCAYFEMFEEAALDADGVLVHDRWNWCVQCQNFQELDDTLCSAPMYCYGCTRVGILPRSLTPAQHRLAIQQKNLLALHADKLD